MTMKIDVNYLAEVSRDYFIIILFTTFLISWDLVLSTDTTVCFYELAQDDLGWLCCIELKNYYRIRIKLKKHFLEYVLPYYISQPRSDKDFSLRKISCMRNMTDLLVWIEHDAWTRTWLELLLKAVCWADRWIMSLYEGRRWWRWEDTVICC